MKLLIVLSVIACSYAAKLDRTYLPPESASTAGGSPGSLSAPTGPGGFGSASLRGSGAAFQPSGPAGPSTFGQPSGPSAFGQSGPSGFGQSGPSQSGQAPGAGNYGQASSGFGQPAAGFNQGGSFNQGAQGQGFNQGFQQPERAQAAADRSAQILRYENENDGETFSYAFETSNGISAEESGVATNGVQAQGGYSYTGDDGQNYRVTYTADENGYQPQGDHLPTPPPIPEEILRSLEKNAAAAAAGIQEGAYNPDEDDSVSGQQYSANGGYSQGPSSFNQPQGRPGQQGAFGPQGGANNQQSGAGAFNKPSGAAQGGAFNQQASTAGFPGSRPSAQGPSTQYNQVAGQFNQNQGPSRPFNQAPGSQAQSDNGYEYNRPQANAKFGSGTQGPSGQFERPSQGNAFSRPAAPSGPVGTNQGSFGTQAFNKPAPARTQGPSGAFSGPSGPAGPSQGSFGRQPYNQPAAQPGSQQYNQNGAQPSGSAFSRPSSPAGPRSQVPGAFRPQYNQASSSGSQGPTGSFSRPSGASQGNFGQAAAGGTQGGAEGYQYNRPGQQGPQSTFGQAAQRQSPQGSPQSTFGQAAQHQGPQGGPQSTFGQAAQHQGPQGGPQSTFGQAAQRPGAQGPQSFPGRGQTFEGPKQPASFSEQDGYKY